MATSTLIELTPELCGEFSIAHLTEASASTASDILNENRRKHDIVFNDFGLHNHIVHHILTVFALGASPDILHKRYLRNAQYQRPPASIDPEVVQLLHDPAYFVENLNKYRLYPSYRSFFEKELSAHGSEEVFKKYIFKGDKRAHIMLGRLYAGVLHPLIHLGYGVEFKQPAILAEALGQTAIHSPWLDRFFPATDEAARQKRGPPKALTTILDEIFADERLSTAARWDDKDMTRDGVFARAWDFMVEHASDWRVHPDKLQEADAEIANAAAYLAGSAQHPPKEIKFDFYFMHSVNCSIGVSSIMNQPEISAPDKARLLEYKGRLDVLQYASRGCPKLLFEEITNYVPKKKEASNWDAIFERVNLIDDDGHAAKLVRALAHGQGISRPWEGSKIFRVKDALWLQLGNMAIDSVEDTHNRWVRHAGFDKAWEIFENRSDASA